MASLFWCWGLIVSSPPFRSGLHHSVSPDQRNCFIPVGQESGVYECILENNSLRKYPPLNVDLPGNWPFKPWHHPQKINRLIVTRRRLHAQLLSEMLHNEAGLHAALSLVWCVYLGARPSLCVDWEVCGGEEYWVVLWVCGECAWDVCCVFVCHHECQYEFAQLIFIFCIFCEESWYF